MSEDWEIGAEEHFVELSCPEKSALTTLECINVVNSDINTAFRCFDCLGDVNINQIDVHPDSYFNFDQETNFLNFDFDNEDKCGSISLFGREWDKGSAIYKHSNALFKMTSQAIMLIEQGAFLNTSFLGKNNAWNSRAQVDYKLLRFHCIEFLLFFRKSIKLLSKKTYSSILKKLFPTLERCLLSLRKQLGHPINLPDNVCFHSSNSNGNKTSQASYHLMHLHLDVRWIYLVSISILSNERLIYDLQNENYLFNTSSLGPDCILTELQSLILDLLELSVKRFDKIDPNLLKYKSPFNCTCVQELWMLIIKFTNTLYSANKEKSFWDFVNLYLDVTSLHNVELSESSSYFYKYFQMNSSKSPMFTLWILYHIGRLYKHVTMDSNFNYAVLEGNLKLIFSSDLSECDLRIALFYIEKLCLEVWEPKAEILLILWEHFHKKINSNFYIPGAPPSSLAIMSKTALGLLNQLKSYMSDINNINDSFQHFLRIIGLHLRKSKKVPRHWNLLKGRLYSKLTLAKLESLSTIGEYHFISLFLILAIAQDLDQITMKMTEIINGYFSKTNYLSEELIKGQLALVILLLENDKDASVALQPVSTFIQSLNIVEHSDKLRMYVETFQDILSLNQPLSLGQHLLIDKWISEYLSSSSENDVSRLLDTLVSLLNRLKMYCDFEIPEQTVILMIENLWDQLSSYLENTSRQEETPYQVSEIAASLACISLQVQKRDRFIEIVNMFVYKNVTDISVLRQFICIISQHDEVRYAMPNYDKVILKTWLKCCFLCSDMEHSEMQELTRAVCCTNEMRGLLGDDKAAQFALSAEPLLDFFATLRKKYTSENLLKRQALREKISTYFEGLDKWIKPIVNSPRNQGRILSLYKTIGHMVCLISPLIYMKSKPNTLLQQLIDLLLLPISVRNPESKIHPHILGAIKSSLHVFIEGLLHLDPENDHYISRILKELVLVYIPRCMTTQNQTVLSYSNFALISRFSDFNDTASRCLLDIIGNNFFKKKSKTPHPSTIFALKFIKELLNTHNKNEQILTSIVSCLFEKMCDIIMYCDEKSTVNNCAKDTLNIILNSSIVFASDKARDGVLGALRKICAENLAWSSKQVFDLILLMTRVAPDLIRRFTPLLLEEVQSIESKRGVGYDRTLRFGVENIEKTLRAIKDVV